jgi:DNA-binding NarL/FixJ family response regulator
VKSEAVAQVSTVLILRSDRLYAELLRQAVLQVFPRAQVRITANVDAAHAVLGAERIDLLITGVGASGEGDVLDLLLRRTAQSFPAPRVLVATASCEYRILAALRSLSVHGVFDSATESMEEFLTALRAVADGVGYWSQTILDQMHRTKLCSTALFRVLTAFEQVVLSVIGDGCDDSAAAQTLGMRPSTISTVRRELHRKLGVQHRGELVRFAAQHGFVRFTPTGVERPGFALLRAGYQSRKLKGIAPEDSVKIALGGAHPPLAA